MAKNRDKSYNIDYLMSKKNIKIITINFDFV